MADFETLALQDRGAVRIITLNRPQLFNALDAQSGSELVAALEQADHDPAVRAVVLTGAGRAYAAGGNIQLMGQGLKQGLPRDPCSPTSPPGWAAPWWPCGGWACRCSAP